MTVAASSALALRGGSPARIAPFMSWPEFGIEEEEAVLRALRSGKWGRQEGSEVARFEQDFAAYHDCRYGVAVVNGSISLKIALLAAGIKAGDEVIVPPYTFLATASVVVEVNAVPVFADIHPDSYCLDPKSVEAAITPRTRAIMVVHLGGLAADMDALTAIAKKHGITLIEDAAHAHGGEYKGKKLGSIGDMGSFSFQSSKNLTSGEGGILTTNNPELEKTARSLHNCGRMAGGAWYGHQILGGNNRLSELQGALLNAQMERLEGQTKRRDKNGRYLNERLAEIPGISPLPRDQGETIHPYHLYVFRYDADVWEGIPRAKFLEAMVAEGIPASPGYIVPLYEQPVFQERRFGPYSGANGYDSDLAANAARCPVTERASRQEGCWLTQNILLGTRSDMDDIVGAVAKVYENRRDLH
ncbi:MAG: DegT/DnrJ/EryC1/StrS family aminotransferase [Armatimonadota bacterium]